MYLTKEQMEKLTTKRLLAYKRKYLYALTVENKEAHDMIVSILNTREHVERK